MNFGKVLFDPGHGTKVNPGTNGYFEGDVMLQLGLLLKAKGFGLTKEDGSDPSLHSRAKMAKELGANTLISLHTDWVPSDNPQSTERTMVIYSLNRPQDKEVAEYLAKEVATALGIAKTKIWTRHSSSSSPENPIDYYGILRHAVKLGIEHVFIIEHCNHAQMSENTASKLQKIADCYERLFKRGNKTLKDIDKVSHWAREAVLRVSDAGIMIGDDQGYFNPAAPITRQEVAVVVDRLLQKIKHDPSS